MVGWAWFVAGKTAELSLQEAGMLQRSHTRWYVVQLTASMFGATRQRDVEFPFQIKTEFS